MCFFPRQNNLRQKNQLSAVCTKLVPSVYKNTTSSNSAFAKILSNDPPTQYSATPFGNFPTGSVLSYQAIDYDKPQVHRESPIASSPLPALPLSIIPCVFDVQSVEERAQLSRINLTLDEAHKLKQSTRQQLQSAKWKESRIGRVTVSRFSDVLPRWSLPSEFVINSFFDTRQHSTTPAPINHGLQNKSKARMFQDWFCNTYMQFSC